MHTASTKFVRFSFFMLAVSLTLGTLGCVRFAANLVNAIQGKERPAEYPGFVEQRVAIACTREGSCSNDATSAMFTRYVHSLLNTNVKKIELVRQDEVDRWLEAHDWSPSDHAEIGEGVKADKLLVVDISGVKLKNGATLFRGVCDMEVTVYDIKNKNAIVFEKQFPEFTFPKEAGPTTHDTTEAKFHNLYVSILARKVATLFYDVDPMADVGLDATSNSY